ncbi:MAG: hypothetical protein Q7R90_03770 [bacterium]|nr:hypothetical protein [bacterium]
MRKRTTQKFKRLNLTLSNDSLERLARIRVTLDAPSDSEVVRRAVHLYDQLLSQTNAEVVLRDKNGKEKLILLV